MGIIVNQSIKNTIITYIGFAIGAANALFMYPVFLGKTYYGLTAFLLSSANILMPLMAFGVHNTLIRFYSGYKSQEQKAQFLNFVLFLPLLLILPFLLTGYLFYNEIANALAKENPIISEYVWLIPLVGLCMGYFEIFYAWVKVHYRSVLGNFIKEVLLRILISIFLFAVFYGFITSSEFIYLLVGNYFFTTLIMGAVALKLQRPALRFHFPANARKIVSYSLFILLSGSVAVLLLDIDKFMLGQLLRIDNVAYYSVAIFIATVVAVPSRSMHQITYPITARLMAENRHDELNQLYKKTSSSLQVVGGFFLLGILINISMLYKMLPAEYAGGIPVVFLIGISKYLDMLLGNNNSIIFNSKYYKTVLLLGILLAVVSVVLNLIFIKRMGINGAAVATLLAVSFYSLAKLLFVVLKMGLFPFTAKTAYGIAAGVILFFSFYFWDFPFQPPIAIALKSVLFTLVYAVVCYWLRLSEDVNLAFRNFMKVLKLK